jgi:murein L,D-transpeptidase YafK
MKKTVFLICLVLFAAGSIYYFLAEEKLPSASRIDRIVVIKSKNQMEVYSGNTLLKVYSVSLGAVDGDKVKEGDRKTPEGKYFIESKNPNSAYYKNLGVSYPDATDLAVAGKRNVSAGGDIKIHGLRNGIGFIGKFHRLFNWTAGCIAVTNQEMDELYQHVPMGTEIIIKP